MKLHYSRHGSADKPPLLLAHGLFGSGDNLIPVARLLENDFDILCPDLRNHGRSPHDDAMNYAAMAADLLELIDDLKLVKVCLLGHSLGGKTVMRFALDYPDRVSKIVVAEIGPKAYGPLFSELFQSLETLDLSKLSSRAEADSRLSLSIPDPATRALMMKNLKADANGKFIWKMNLEALSEAKTKLGLALEASAPFTGPACFIRGQLSNYILDKDIPAIKRLFPALVLRTLPGAGHWLHADQPLAFASNVRDFLRGRL